MTFQHVPIFPSLFFKELVKLQHLQPGDDVDLKLGQQLVDQPQVVVDQAFTIPPHTAAGPPEKEDSVLVLAGIEQLLSAPQHPLQAGVCDDAQAGASAYVPLEARGRGVVHADDTLVAVDIGAPPAARQVAGAGHQGTAVTVHPQRLGGH